MRANPNPRWRAVLLATTTVASAGLLAIGPASPAHADLACATGNGAYLVWMRGSGQYINDIEAQRFYDYMVPALNNVGITSYQAVELGNLDRSVPADGWHYPDNSNEYPAVPVTDWHVLPPFYGSSVEKGTNELIAHLNDRYGSVGRGGYEYTTTAH